MAFCLVPPVNFGVQFFLVPPVLLVYEASVLSFVLPIFTCAILIHDQYGQNEYDTHKQESTMQFPRTLRLLQHVAGLVRTVLNF